MATLGESMANVTHMYVFEKEDFKAIDLTKLDVVDTFKIGLWEVIELRRENKDLQNHPRLIDHTLGDLD